VAVPRGGGVAGLRQQQLEAAHVDIAGSRRQDVPLGAAVQQPVAQQLAQPGDVGLHRPAGVGRQVLAPDRLGQLVHGDQRTGAQQQAGQQRALPGRRDRHHPTLVGDLEQPQQAELHRFPYRISRARTYLGSLAIRPRTAQRRRGNLGEVEMNRLPPGRLFRGGGR
jgi:hypothetical protein